MSLRTALVAALSTGLCCSLLAVGSSDANPPSLPPEIVDSLTEASGNAAQLEEAAIEQVPGQAPEEDPVEEEPLEGNGADEGPGSSEGPNLRRLKARRGGAARHGKSSRNSPQALGPGWGGFLL